MRPNAREQSPSDRADIPQNNTRGKHMSEIILHHYPLSPYSEKVRLALGLKGVSWRSVEIPVWTPRPKLTPMTGGYRRTPILQIGAEFYCDTLHILRAIEGLGTSGALYPKGQEGLAKASRLVDREGLLHQRRLSHDRQHAWTPPRTHRRTASALPGQPRSRGIASQACAVPAKGQRAPRLACRGPG